MPNCLETLSNGILNAIGSLGISTNSDYCRMLRTVAQAIKKHIFGKPVFYILLIAVIGFLAYSNTFNAPFQWDEDVFLRENPIIKNLNYFLEPSKARGLPFYDGFIIRYLGYLTFAVNYKLHGFAVQGYHIVNVCIHLINAALAYFFVLLTFRSPFLRDSRLSDKSKAIAFSISLLFAIHPIQTEAVTYVFQRLASLAALFYLLSIVSYAYSRLSAHKKNRYIFYALSILSAAAAMKTKENAFSLPFVIALYEFCFFGPSPGVPTSTHPRVGFFQRVLYLAPLLLTSCIVPLSLIRTMMGSGKHIHQVMAAVAVAGVGYPEMPRWPYLFTQFRVIITYLRLMFVPVNQNLIYDYPLYKSFFVPQVMLSFIFLSVLFILGIYLLKKTAKRTRTEGEGLRAEREDQTLSAKSSVFISQSSRLSPQSSVLSPEFRLIGFGILWFFMTLSVESSIIPLPTLIDEYRMYLPSVGFFTALCTALFLLAERIRFDRERRMLLQLCFVVIAVLFGMTYARNDVWSNKVAFWKDVTEKSPNSSQAWNNMGNAYIAVNQPDKALEALDRAVTLSPKSVLARHNKGEAYLLKKEYDYALENFAKANDLQKNSKSYTGIGIAYLEKGEPSLAEENLFKALAMNPHSEGPLYALAVCYGRNGKYNEAMQLFGKILRDFPYDSDAYRNRGEMFMARKEYAKAIADFTSAVRIDQKDIVAHYKCAVAYQYLGQYEFAIREYTRAIALYDKSPALYDGRGRSYYYEKNYVRSIGDYTKAIELNQAYAPTHVSRGLAYSALKESDHALADFNKALSLDSNLPVAYTERGKLYLMMGENSKALIDLRRGCALKDSDACSRLKMQ